MPAETEPLKPIASPEMIDQGIRLGNILMPYAMKQRKAFFEKVPNQTYARLIHYTTAESALKIINSKRFWMRNTNCKADYREVQHGYDIFLRYFNDQAKLKAFTETLAVCAPGVAQEAIQMFDASWNNIRFNTYISSISEHEDQEDQHGRLSMWRAFGSSAARVGIVLKIPYISQGSLALNLLFSPVAYLPEVAAHRVLDQVIENIRASCDFIRNVDHAVLVRTVFLMLLAGVVCLKHEGFHEEREWRAIYAPHFWPSPLMESSTEVVAGIPQVIYKIPVDASVSSHLADIDFATMFDRLIVGPTPYPWPMYQAFVPALKQAGVADAENRIFPSGIPIRA
jgi:hypothetical protein